VENLTKNDQSWKEAQNLVAEFLQKHEYAIKQEFTLKSGKRIDIIGIKKINNQFLHVLIEVKDWNTVTRKKEMEFSKQIIQYIVEYSLEESIKVSNKEKWKRKESDLRDMFVGILCLTKDAHFSFRKISQHFITKNKNILGIPLREQIAENISLFVSRFDFLPRVFQELGQPLYKQKKLLDWL